MMSPTYSAASARRRGRSHCFQARADVITVGAKIGIHAGGLVVGRRVLRDFGSSGALFGDPFGAAAIHQTNVFVAVILEEPEGVGGEPVVVVAIEDDGSIRRDARFGEQAVEFILGEDVAVDLILQLRFPV